MKLIGFLLCFDNMRLFQVPSDCPGDSVILIHQHIMGFVLFLWLSAVSFYNKIDAGQFFFQLVLDV